jgi:TPR repeat protein
LSDVKKAEIFLTKAYVLAQDKRIPAHNLSVLYARYNELHDLKKAIKYLKESKMPIDIYNLGVYYYMGAGVKEDDKKAREYFKMVKDKIIYAKKNYEEMKKNKIGIK